MEEVASSNPIQSSLRQEQETLITAPTHTKEEEKGEKDRFLVREERYLLSLFFFLSSLPLLHLSKFYDKWVTFVWLGEISFDRQTYFGCALPHAAWLFLWCAWIDGWGREREMNVFKSQDNSPQ